MVMCKRRVLMHPHVAWRLKAASLGVIAVGVMIVGMAITYGDMPRPLVNRMNQVLGPATLILLAVTFYCVYRHRCAVIQWQREHGG